MRQKKYSSCSKCTEAALDIQLGTSKKQWCDLGNGQPQCKKCLVELKKQLFPPVKNN